MSSEPGVDEVEMLLRPSSPAGAGKEKVSSGLVNFLAGGFGGICLTVVGHPMDLVKVKIQTGGHMYKGALDVAVRTVTNEGFRGLYRGVSAPLVGITPIFAVVFWGYDMGLKLVRYGRGLGPEAQLSIPDKCFAGAFSALPATVLMAPIERMKCLLQIQGQEVASGRLKEAQYKSMVDCGTKLFRQGGMKSLFRGWEATLMRDIPGSIGYFGAYEYLKQRWTEPDGSVSNVALLCAGGVAGVVNWIIAIPADCVKSGWQTAPEGAHTSMMSVARSIIKADGIPGLYRGLAPALLRAAPANAACFYGVAVGRDFLDKAGL